MTDKICCVLIEDELPAATVLKMYIAKFDFLQLKATFGSATQALKYLNTNHTDLLFLDINLPEITGLSLLKSLSRPPHVIFTTAYAEYAVEGFDLEAVDYLIKPVPFERFVKALNRFLKMRQKNEPIVELQAPAKERPFMFIKCDKNMVKIFLDEILYFEAQKNYLTVCTIAENYRTYHSISEMEEKLPEQLFIRLHRSFIVAIDKIAAYNRDFVTINKIEVPIGRIYRGAVLTLFRKKAGSYNPE